MQSSTVPRGISPTQPSHVKQTATSTSAIGSFPISHSQQQLLAKLDGVIYHIYTTTANLILQTRLIQYRRRLQQPSPAQSLQPRFSKWFALQLPEIDIFKDELRLWRSLSSMLSFDAAGKVLQQHSDPVPPLVIDVILDLSKIPDNHLVFLLKKSHTLDPPHFLANDGTVDISWDDRVSIDGVQLPGLDSKTGLHPSSPTQPPQTKSHLIVLERWKLEFVPHNPDSPPELPTLYKRSIAHFRAMYSLIHALPTSRLCTRVEKAKQKAAQSEPGFVSTASHPSFPISTNVGELDHQLELGCRLSMTEQDTSLPGQVTLSDVLFAEKFDSTQSETDNSSKADNSPIAHRKFSPIVTRVGQLVLSMSFRKLTDFSIQDIETIKSVKEMQIEMDEDYFRPTVEMVRKRSGSGSKPLSARKEISSSLRRESFNTKRPQSINPGPIRPSEQGPDSVKETKPDLSSVEGETLSSETLEPLHIRSDSEPDKLTQPRSLLTATAHQKIGGISAGRLSALAPSSGSSTVAEPAAGAASLAFSSTPPTVPDYLFPCPNNSTSVFSTSAPGRPVAGLSSLRRTGSTTSNLSVSTHPGMAAPAPSSPALAAVLTSAEPAFLALGISRRPSSSASDRRIRSQSGQFSSKPSPPSPTIANPDSSSSSAVAAVSMAKGPSLAPGYPALGRVISTSIPITNANLIPGSFSPSSPSPLAQQMSSREPSSLQVSSSSTSFSGIRLSSSPGMRSTLSGAAVPSLRSVFQSYVPQSSAAMSYSRTPPKSISMTSMPPHSPSSLGGFRSASGRRFSNTSEAGSGSALLSSSSGARPQMIKRYNTNFAYRQNRERTVYGSSLGGGGGGGDSQTHAFGGEPSSLPSSSGGGSLGSAYSRSWAARMEQRQALGAFARSSNSLEEGASGSGSTSLRFRSSPAAGATPTGAITPSPKSQEEDIDELMRLLESRPALRRAGRERQTDDRSPQPTLSSSISKEEKKDGSSTSSSGVLMETGTLERNRPSLASSSSSISKRSASGRPGYYSSLRGTNPLSRSQVDDMLNKMAQSVNMLSLGGGSGSFSAHRGARLQTASGLQNSGVGSLNPSAGTGARLRPHVREAFDFDVPSGGENSLEPSRAPTPYHTVSSPILASEGGCADNQPQSIGGGGQIRGLQGGATGTSSASKPSLESDEVEYQSGAHGALGLIRNGGSRPTAASSGGMEDDDDDDMTRRARRPNRKSPTSSLLMENDGDAYSFSQNQPKYDFTDDEAAGRLELMTGDLFEDEDYTQSAPTRTHGYRLHDDTGVDELGAVGLTTAQPGKNLMGLTGVGSGGGGTGTSAGTTTGFGTGYHLRKMKSSSGTQHHLSPPSTAGHAVGIAMDWEREERQRERERELERRKADAEMARNFGKEVGASTRGRGSRSPWRNPLSPPLGSVRTMGGPSSSSSSHLKSGNPSNVNPPNPPGYSRTAGSAVGGFRRRGSRDEAAGRDFATNEEEKGYDDGDDGGLEDENNGLGI